MSDNGIVSPLLQRHIEPFVRTLREQGISLSDPFASIKNDDGDYYLIDAVPISGEIVRAAKDAGMLNGAAIDELEPWQVAELASHCLVKTSQSLTVPKASSSPQPTTPTGQENA